MMKTVSRPRFFVYDNKEVKEVNENEFYLWTNVNWHPSHLKHSNVANSHDEVWLGFQGHYKFCEWQGKPFNINYFVYGNDVQWLEVYDEYFATYEEALERFNNLTKHGYISLEKSAMSMAA